MRTMQNTSIQSQRWINFWDPSAPSRSLIVSVIPQQMSSTAQLALFANLLIGETGWQLGDRFREHLRDVDKDDNNASKPVARHFNLPYHSKQHMAVCGLSLHQGNTESHKTLEQKFIFQIDTLNPHVINGRFFIQLIYSVVFHVTMHQPIA